MTDQAEIIVKFSQLISSRYRWYGWIAGAVWLAGVFCLTWFNPVYWLTFFANIMMGLGLGFLIYIFNHRYQMLFHFNTRYADPYERLEKYLVEKRQRWEKIQMIRLGLMALLFLTMLTLMFFFKEHSMTLPIVTLFIALILAAYIKGWLDFSDEILLQDIRHSLRDQTSE